MTSNDLKDLLTEYIKISKNNLGVFKKHALLFPKKDPTFKKAWNKYGKENVSTKYTSHTGEKYLNKSTRKYADYRGLTIQRGSSTSGYISSGKLAPYIAFLNANQAVNDGIYPFYSYNPTGDVLYLMYAVSNKTPKPPKPTWNFSSAGKTLAGGVYKSYNCASINTWNYQQMLDELDDVIDDLEITLNITPRTARTDGKIGIGTGNIIPPAGSLPLHKTQSDSKHPLNLILYGPPGTGKTYNTLFHALAIIKGEDVAKLQEEVKTGVTTYENLKQEYDRYIDSKQIVFSTFHQSMSYEDFIEGIKPIPVEGNIVAIHKNDTKSSSTLFGDGTTTIANLSRMKYDVRDGIFKDLCNRALDFDFAYNYLKDEVSNNRKVNTKSYLLSVSKSGNVLVDGKSISQENLKLYYDYFQEKSWEECEKNRTNKDWWDNKIAELTENKTEHVDYTYYYALLSELRNTRFILIIDEINRGNVAQIFGELITLIEENKRLGNKEVMTATLPYSQELFGVPNNLNIIGTMNTADRSVEALDTALRRRFDFEEMMPKPELLTKIELTKGDPTSAIDLKEVLEKINDRIIVLKDREHQIGHSYFMGHDDKNEDGSDKYQNKKEWLTNVFKDKIIPLLQEYFYGDYKKIYYVLGGSETEGEGFVKIDSVKSDIFAVKIDDFEYDIPEKRYEIQKIDDTFDIDRAIKVLLGTE